RLKAVRFELAEYRRKRELEAVEHLTPEERRQKIREWTRRIAGGGVIIAAFALAWDWLRRMLRQHPGPAVLAAAGTTMAGTALAFSLWGLSDGTVQGDVPGAAPAPSAPDSGPVAAPSPVDEATAGATAPDLPDVEVDATVAPVDEGSAADTEVLAGS